eukprot:CAMPEP_0198197010 /NCGR_PEP_ID=MMETSP1445-20131203/601_1 /TAXON_ID=36898 /ORGANISM="Pyramimonas sp., Strain CCMP2087" /LENGTH=219 /DNA_ID=CAMNT_0043866139 /DNA_START=221 /DNA_END=879 /DNA_ORIENTATION=-
MGGGINAFTEKVVPANTTALMDLLKGVEVLIDENYAADPRTYTKDMFLGQYGVNETMIASGDWPFLTDERVFRVDKHHGDGTYDSPYGGKSYPLEWYARRNTNPNEFVSDVAFALYPTVFPQYSNTYFLRNIMKDEPTVMNRAADCTEDCANAADDSTYDSAIYDSANYDSANYDSATYGSGAYSGWWRLQQRSRQRASDGAPPDDGQLRACRSSLPVK